MVVESCEFVESKSAQQSSQDAGGLNQADNDGFMNVPEGIDEELPF